MKGLWNSKVPVFKNLEELHCRNNNIHTIPSIPNLKYLDCENNQLIFESNDINMWKKYHSHRLEIISKICIINRLCDVSLYNMSSYNKDILGIIKGKLYNVIMSWCMDFK